MKMLFAVQGILSYPFFDPVLTDRAFLAHPQTMLWVSPDFKVLLVQVVTPEPKIQHIG